MNVIIHYVRRCNSVKLVMDCVVRVLSVKVLWMGIMMAFPDFGYFPSILVAMGRRHEQRDTSFHFSEIALEFPEKSARRNYRESIPPHYVPHFYKGDIVRVEICTDVWTDISLTNITYSNDGASDLIKVNINGHHIGEFKTISHSNWGHLWEDFHGSGQLGTRTIPPGVHVIELHVAESLDCYGVEIADLFLSANKMTSRYTFWCGHSFTLAPTQKGCLPRADESYRDMIKPTTLSPPVSTQTPVFVTVRQYSYTSDCLDERNVRISFSCRNLTDTVITVMQENIHPPGALATGEGSTAASMCKNLIWQLGKTDGNNKEFLPLTPEKSIVINITGPLNQEFKFPAKILTFATEDLELHFRLPDNVTLHHGSVFFTLGLVNLTRTADIGLEYFDHTVGSLTGVHFVKFTPQHRVMGWNIPNIGKTDHKDNVIRLHFRSTSNIIMFDFLKLEYTVREGRRVDRLVATHGKWQVRVVQYNATDGMTVTVNGNNPVHNVEKVNVMHAFKHLHKYQCVLRIHHDGLLFPYKPYQPTTSKPPHLQVDVSGVLITSSLPEHNFTSPISSVRVDTSSESIAINYKDLSVLVLKLVSSEATTEIFLKSFLSGPSHNQSEHHSNQTITFLSNHVTDDTSAIDELSGLTRSHVMDELFNYDGEFNYTLRSSAPTNLFYSNNRFELHFPT